VNSKITLLLICLIESSFSLTFFVLIRLLERLKREYSEERTVLLARIEAMETEKQRLVVEMTELGTENEILESKKKSLEDALA